MSSNKKLTKPKLAQKLPDLVERVISHCQMLDVCKDKSGDAYQAAAMGLGAVLADNGFDCQVLVRAVSCTSKSKKFKEPYFVNLMVLKIEGQVFELDGTCGWKAILDDYWTKNAGQLQQVGYAGRTRKMPIKGWTWEGYEQVAEAYLLAQAQVEREDILTHIHATQGAVDEEGQKRTPPLKKKKLF